jgi:hypothetical protein
LAQHRVPWIGPFLCFGRVRGLKRKFSFRFHKIPIGRQRDGIEQHQIFAETVWPVNFSFAHPKAELAFADAQHGGCLA